MLPEGVFCVLYGVLWDHRGIVDYRTRLFFEAALERPFIAAVGLLGVPPPSVLPDDRVVAAAAFIVLTAAALTAPRRVPPALDRAGAVRVALAGRLFVRAGFSGFFRGIMRSLVFDLHCKH